MIEESNFDLVELTALVKLATEQTAVRDVAVSISRANMEGAFKATGTNLRSGLEGDHASIPLLNVIKSALQGALQL